MAPALDGRIATPIGSFIACARPAGRILTPSILRSRVHWLPGARCKRRRPWQRQHRQRPHRTAQGVLCTGQVFAAIGVARLRAANVSAVTRIAKKRKKAPYLYQPCDNALQHIESSREIRKKRSRVAQTGSLDPRIVPDAKWPGVYRIRLPHGQRVTAHRLGRYRRQHEPGSGPLAAR
jgi:hypothetical protein